MLRRRKLRCSLWASLALLITVLLVLQDRSLEIWHIALIAAPIYVSLAALIIINRSRAMLLELDDLWYAVGSLADRVGVARFDEHASRRGWLIRGSLDAASVARLVDEIDDCLDGQNASMLAESGDRGAAPRQWIVPALFGLATCATIMIVPPWDIKEVVSVRIAPTASCYYPVGRFLITWAGDGRSVRVAVDRLAIEIGCVTLLTAAACMAMQLGAKSRD